MVEKIHDDTFVINDVVLSIPPEEIHIQRKSLPKVIKALRTQSSIKIKSGHSAIDISFSVPFVGPHEINTKLRPLIAQFLLTPFCYVENKFLRDSIMAGSDDSQNMALALQALNINTVPGEPHTLQATFNFTWFNYLPYTPHFYFKDKPFDPSTIQKEPGLAFKLFYAAKLNELGTVSLLNSDVKIQCLEFILAKDNDEIIANLETLDESRIEDFEGKLSQYLDIVEQLQGPVQSDEQLGESTLLDQVITLKSQLDPADPNLLRSSVNKIIQTISKATEKYKEKKDTRVEKYIKQLESQRNEILQAGSKLFGGKVWLEWPGNLVAGNDRDEGQPKVYYRVKELTMGGFDSPLIVEAMTLSYQHILANIPLASHQYPTCQFLGSSDVQVAMTVKCTSDEALQELNNLYNTTQNNYLNVNYIAQEYKSVVVENELVQLMGVRDMMWIQNDVHTIPDSPGIYNIQLGFIEAGLQPSDVEAITAVPRSNAEVRRAIWRAIFNHLTTEVGSPVGKLRITGHLQKAERQLLERILETNIWSGETWALFSSVGARQHLFRIYDMLKFNNIFPQFDIEGIKGSFHGGKGTITHGFRNLLLVNSLTDKYVLGADGISRIFWGWGENAAAGKYIGMIQPSDMATDIYKSGRIAARQRIQKSLSKILRDKAERAEKIKQAIAAIRAWERAKDIGGNIKSNGFVVEVEGEELDLRDALREAGLLEELERRITQITAFRRDFNKINMNISRNRYAILLPEDLISINNAAIKSYLSDIKKEYNDIVDTETVKDPRKLIAQTVFAEWNEFAIRTADVIMQKYINFPMFREARELMEKMKFTPATNVYRDFPMEQIKSSVLQWVSGQQDIAPPKGWVCEPDFYFVNDTADSDITSIVPFEVIERVREDTRTFANKVITENSTWYQEKYLQKTNPEFRQFLIRSQDSEVTAFPDTVMMGFNGLSQVKSPFNIIAKSSNNQTIIDGQRIDQGAEVCLNQPGDIPKATRQLTHINSAEAVLDGATAGSPYDPVVADVYGRWVHPMPGSVITSYPGKRGSDFHRGTDFAYIGGDAKTMNQPIYAAASGEVKFVGFEEGGAGNYVKIITQHPIYGELAHLYMHMNGFAPGLAAGQQIKAGELIGFCGATGINRSKTSGQKGAHLHFEIYATHNRNIVYYPFFTFNSKNIENVDPTGQGRVVVLADLITYGDQPSPILPNQTGIEFGTAVLDKSIESFAKRWNQHGGYRMNRAYPGIYLSFIEEDAGEVIFRHDDFFSYSSIVDVQISKSREVAADYAQITLTNVSGLLSNRKFWGTYLEDKIVNNGKAVKENPDDLLAVDTADENPIDSFMLREGIKVELRLGYSNDPLNLEPVIVGRIVGYQFSDTDDLVTIEIQSLGMEVVQDIKGLNKVEKKDGWFVSDARTGPLLEELISSPECVSFGMWKRGEQVGNSFRFILNDRWEWNPNPAADNIFAPDSSFLDPRTVFLFKSFLGQALEVVSGSALINILASAEVHVLQKLLSQGFSVFGAEKLAQKVAPSSDKIGIYSALSYYIHQMTIWDVFKEMELRHPGYIASIVPYYERGGNARVTMFFGLPDQLYFAKDAEWSDDLLLDEIAQRAEALNKRLSQLKSIGQFKEQIREVLESISTPEEEIAEIIGDIRFIPENGTNHFTSQIYDFNNRNEVVNARKEVVERYKLSEERKLALGTGAIQPFRNYHLLTSRHHIISNTIRARSTTTANAVTVQYAEDGDEDVKLENVNGSEVPTISDAGFLTLKMDPHIPEESTREAFHSFYNCQGEEMAKRYALSLLQKYAWQVYSGQLVILGNPSIKPYDICYIFDDYSDMYGPIQVRSVDHYFSYETGFITVITPDLVATISEGAELTQEQAMGLMAEAYLKRAFNVDVQLIEPGETPVEGANITPFLYSAAVGVMKLANFFGAKRLIFNTQFNWPIRVHPLLHHGEPIIAGFGPPELLENEFTIDAAFRWISKGFKGLSEKMSEFVRAIRISPVDTRGRYTRGSFFGGGINPFAFRGK